MKFIENNDYALIAATSATETIRVSMMDFLNLDMSRKLILSINFKQLPTNRVYRSFKVLLEANS